MSRVAGAACASVVALVALVAFAASACHRDAPPEELGTASTTPPPEPTAPVDHLAPGELLEGSDRAFGIVLPRGLTMYGSFPGVVYASGQVALHPLTQYLRARLRDGSLREGEAAAEFEHVRSLGDDDRELTIHVDPVPTGLRVEIRDVTPKPIPALPDEAARWRQAGLTPQGRVADPTHLD